MSKKWKPFPGECPDCGAEVEILTKESLPDDHGYDGDEIQCTACDEKAYWSADSDGGRIHWLSEDC